MPESEPLPPVSPCAVPSAEYVLAQLDHLPELNHHARGYFRLAAERMDDPKLTSELIGFLDNFSDFFGDARRFHKSEETDARRFVESVGAALAASTLVAVTMAREFTPGHFAETGAELQTLWRESLAVACAARRVAALRGAAMEVVHRAFVAGLEHDCGRFALLQTFPRAYRRVAEARAAGGRDLRSAEQAVWGVDHTVAGRRWMIASRAPSWIVDCAWLHHQPTAAVAALPHGELIVTLQLARVIAREHGLIGDDGDEACESVAALAQRLSLDAAQLGAAMSGLAREVDDHLERLGLLVGTEEADPAAMRAELARLRRELADANDITASLERARELSRGCVEALSQRLDELDMSRAMRSAFDLLKNLAADRPAAIVAYGIEERVVWLIHSGDAGRVTTIPIDETVAASLRAADVGVGRAPESRLPPAIAGVLADLPAELQNDAVALRLVRAGRLLGAVLLATRGSATELPGAAELFWAIGGLLDVPLTMMRLHRQLEHFAQQQQRHTAAVAESAEPRPGDRDGNDPDARARAMEMIAELAAGAAHELNNPLSVIAGRAQMLRLHAEQDPALLHGLAQIESKAHECSQIISSLMDFAQPPEPVIAPVAVGDLVRDALSEWQRQVGLGAMWVRVAGFEGGRAAEEPLIAADVLQMRTVLVELLRNAAEATRENEGLISIDWRHAHESTEGGMGRTVSTASEPDRDRGAAMLIRVRDSGRGMTADVLARAFDPFFSHRPAGRGRGLGLARASRIVAAHGGRIWLESTPGRGTDVCLQIPLSAALPADEHAIDRAP